MIDVPLPHLDRPFDYLVPADLDTAVRIGARVRVRFAGQLVDGYVLERRETSDHPGQLAYIERAVGDEPVLTPDTTALFRAVADRWAGSFVDVIRLGVPSRHAGSETSWLTPPTQPAPPDSSGWARYRTGPAFLTALTGGRAARAAWCAMPGEDWPLRLAELARAVLAVGRGAILLVPDARHLNRLNLALSSALGSGRHVALSADLGPAERYRRWLLVRRGLIRAVIGTRAAAFAPVADLSLVAIWDDGDDLYAEPRAPYPHARDVLVLRAAQTGTALLMGGFARTAEAQQLVESGWAHDIVADRGVVRSSAPRVRAVGDDGELARDPAARAARLPSLAWRIAREALDAGRAVLVQVPRRGYVPALACATDRTPARCSSCSGPLAATSASTVASCRWCGRSAADWACPTCGGNRLRAVVIGSARTAEELGRAFPGTPVRVSAGDSVLAAVPDRPTIVVATPGAEPLANAGYGAALLLDGWALLSRADLRAGEETLRRWANAAALVRTDGQVIVGADAAVPVVQAMIRWDARGFAARELADRQQLRFPPTVRMAALTGQPAAVEEFLSLARLPDSAQLIGPVAARDDAQRTLIRVPRASGAELATALKTAASTRSARKAPNPVRVVLDPLDLF
jgi:primosomal protein N' (replication factor Y)